LEYVKKISKKKISYSFLKNIVSRKK